MKDEKKILIVDDEESFRTHLARLFVRKGYHVADVGSGQEAMSLADEKPWDIVLLDIVLPDLDGVEVLRSLREHHPDIQVIMMTGNATINNAVSSMKLGAYDYLTKPFDFDELTILVERACELSTLRRESKLLRHELERQQRYDEFVAQDRNSLEVLELVEKVAPTDSTVLITGETGTGKELIAKALHRRSPRRRRPFVVVNCTAIQETLLESELFGHEKGAFTGAVRDKAGLIEVADTGTLFLDEVGELSTTLQTKLLRFLENGEYRRLGSTRTQRADVRVVAATNRDLRELMESGGFREDLFYRLNVIHISLPPLRQRPYDIPALVDYCLKKICSRLGKCVTRIEPDALGMLLQYHWPGNVRELENVMERAVILATGDAITLQDLPADIVRSTHEKLEGVVNNHSLAYVEREHVLHVLRQTGGNKTQAARVLGITKKTLYAKLRSYGIFP